MTFHSASAVKWITIHYTATPVPGRPINAAMINRWHRERGYRKIGYHYLIRLDGTIESGRAVKPNGDFEQGAHSRGENDESIGVCYEGGLHPDDLNKGLDTRTPEQRAAMVLLIKKLLNIYPQARVEGHRDMPSAATQCPGFDAAAWWAEVQAREAMPPDVEPAPVRRSVSLWERIKGFFNADRPTNGNADAKTDVGYGSRTRRFNRR